MYEHNANEKIQTVYTSWCGETAQLQQQQLKFVRQNMV